MTKTVTHRKSFLWFWHGWDCGRDEFIPTKRRETLQVEGQSEGDSYGKGGVGARVKVISRVKGVGKGECDRGGDAGCKIE